jgi:hypothetical protein
MLDAVPGTLVDKLIGQALFLFAVVPNLVLLVIGVLFATVWLLGALFRAKPAPRLHLEVAKEHRPRSLGIGAQLGISAIIAVVLAAVFVRGDHTFGQVMFILAVGPNVVLLAYGVARAAIWLFGAGLGMMTTPALRHAHPDDAFHHPDPIATPAFHQIFMLGAIGLVIVGLPVALGAIFHFVLPLMGEGWGQ